MHTAAHHHFAKMTLIIGSLVFLMAELAFVFYSSSQVALYNTQTPHIAATSSSVASDLGSFAQRHN